MVAAPVPGLNHRVSRRAGGGRAIMLGRGGQRRNRMNMVAAPQQARAATKYILCLGRTTLYCRFYNSPCGRWLNLFACARALHTHLPRGDIPGEGKREGGMAVACWEGGSGLHLAHCLCLPHHLPSNQTCLIIMSLRQIVVALSWHCWKAAPMHGGGRRRGTGRAGEP